MSQCIFVLYNLWILVYFNGSLGKISGTMQALFEHSTNIQESFINHMEMSIWK